MTFSQHNKASQLEIHDQLVTDLMNRLNFTQAIYFTWTGKFLTEAQEELLNACLIALIDHGAEPLSAQAARVISSGGADTHAAVAGGLLAAGKYHGAMVLQHAAQIISEAVANKQTAASLVKQYITIKKRLPGFGHKLYKDGDPRAQALLAKANKLDMVDMHVQFLLQMEEALEQAKGQKLPVNIDGVIAALMPGLGITPDLAPGVFLVARTVGLLMHVHEEQQQKPMSKRS